MPASIAAARLRRESGTFIAEQRTLISKPWKFDRDRGFPPWFEVAGLIGGVVGLATLILEALGKV